MIGGHGCHSISALVEWLRRPQARRMTDLQLGLFGINMSTCATVPAQLAAVAEAAEASGWESVWAGEHYVLPDPRVPISPAPPETPMLDPFVSLAVVAAHTERLLIGTGVIVVPLHQPLALAKRVASLDRVSDGRFLLGVGVGYLQPEFEALGAPMARRGRRLVEDLDAMHAIWNGGTEGLRAEPQPVQKPGPPVHFGGYVDSTYRRAVERGHGWYGFALDLAATEACIANLQRAGEAHTRPDHLPPLEVSVTPHPRVPLDRASAEAFAAMGVTRLIPLIPLDAATDPAALLAFVKDLPDRLR
jgi:probable F420-dependent oxidoreductase